MPTTTTLTVTWNDGTSSSYTVTSGFDDSGTTFIVFTGKRNGVSPAETTDGVIHIRKEAVRDYKVVTI